MIECDLGFSESLSEIINCAVVYIGKRGFPDVTYEFGDEGDKTAVSFDINGSKYKLLRTDAELNEDPKLDVVRTDAPESIGPFRCKAHHEETNDVCFIKYVLRRQSPIEVDEHERDEHERDEHERGDEEEAAAIYDEE